MPENRANPRGKKRLTCTLIIKGIRHTGVVLDVSKSGLFVQTNARPTGRDFLEIHLTLPGQKKRLVLQARVTRKKVVPARLLAVAHGGIGLKVICPPPAYLEFAATALPMTRSEVRSVLRSASKSQAAREPKRSAR